MDSNNSQEGYNAFGIWKGGLSPLVFNNLADSGLLPNQVNQTVSPSAFNDGQLAAQMQQISGTMYAFKTSFTDDTAGYRLGFDTVDGICKFKIGNAANYLFWDGTTLSIQGTFVLGGTLITINDITKLQAAINTVNGLGGGTVALVPDTYNATTSFTYLSNVAIDGNGSTIDFGGTANNISATGTNVYSTGTLAVSFGSGSVVGTGTTWTAGMVGQSILIGDYWYSITARTDNTHITISPTFRAPSVSGVTYVIATTIDGIVIKNITLTNNITVPIFDYRYVNGIIQDTLTCSISPQGVRGRDSSINQWVNSLITTCTAGHLLNNVPFCTLNNSNIIDISGGSGMDLTSITNTSIGIISIQNITGVGLKFTSCSNLGILNYSIIECTSHGMECVSGNSALSIDAGEVNTVGGDGIKLTATSSHIEITGNNALNCTGYGVNIANANCSSNTVAANDLSVNNTAGNLNNSGTSTKIRGNPGVSDNIAEADLSLTDITTNDASTSKHGFQAKGTNSTSTFYRSDNTQAAVTDANLSVSDITTNNATTSAHGFMPKGTGSTTTFFRSDMTQAVPSGGLTGFGAWASATTGSATQAATDGILVVVITMTSGTAAGATIKSDAANPPTVVRANVAITSTTFIGTMTCPVKKNDYYLIAVTGSASITSAYFIPLS